MEFIFKTEQGCGYYFKSQKAVTRAAEMVKRGADTIFFASPHAEQMKNAIEKKVGETIRFIDYTH